MKNIAITAALAAVLATTSVNASAALSAAEGDTWAGFGAKSAQRSLPIVSELTSEFLALIAMRVADDFVTTNGQTLNADNDNFYEVGAVPAMFKPTTTVTIPADQAAFEALLLTDPETAAEVVFRLRFRRAVKGQSSAALNAEGAVVADADHVLSITRNRTVLEAARKDANGEIVAAESIPTGHTIPLTEADAGPRLEQFMRVRSLY